ncbi:hypothetical protein NST07_20765 [Paenibacillus sp. FSL L8-0340]|uniref:hypothetical protein n=1 Tax=Paenibacillus sp. FSL L8-0340 TaxID=2954685 RepID=UPI0031585866
MTQYEVGKKYKKIVTVAKVHKDLASVLMIDDKRYVLQTHQPTEGSGKNGRKNKKKAISH